MQKSFCKCPWELSNIDDVFDAQTLVPYARSMNQGCAPMTVSMIDNSQEQLQKVLAVLIVSTLC